MSETTERATGATDEQIEAAVERHWQEIIEERPDATRTSTYTYEIEREIAGIACYLVPPGYRIVPADAVPTEAEREALNGRITAWDRQFRQGAELVYLDKYSLELLRRLVERGGEPT